MRPLWGVLNVPATEMACNCNVPRSVELMTMDCCLKKVYLPDLEGNKCLMDNFVDSSPGSIKTHTASIPLMFKKKRVEVGITRWIFIANKYW